MTPVPGPGASPGPPRMPRRPGPAEVAAAYRSGLSQRVVAEKFSISLTTVAATLRAENVTLRPAGQQARPAPAPADVRAAYDSGLTLRECAARVPDLARRRRRHPRGRRHDPPARPKSC